MPVNTYRYNRDGNPEIDKTTVDELDYPFDWTDWLQDDETIVSQECSVPDDSAGLVLGDVSRVGAVVVPKVSGGTNKRTGRLRCEITTQTRVVQRTIWIRVKLDL